MTDRTELKHVELSPAEWDRLKLIGESDEPPTPALRRTLWRIAVVEVNRARTNLRAFYGIANQRHHGRRPTARERKRERTRAMQRERRELRRVLLGSIRRASMIVIDEVKP